MRRLSFLVYTALAVLTSACGKTGTPVSGVSLDKNDLTMVIGDVTSLNVTVIPTDATNKDVEWSTDVKSIAEVDNNGRITAKAVGTTKITVKTVDGGKKASCTVHVLSSAVHVTSVTLEETSATLYLRGSKTLKATVLPEDATDKKLSWSSDNTAVAEVNADGKVTAISTGKANVTVTTNDGGKTANCAIEVLGEKPGLSREEAETARLKVISDWKESIMDEMQNNLLHSYVEDSKGNRMKFLVDVYGNEPSGGHSLWISLHGGGGTTADVNDGQWKNQQVMYRNANPPQPTEGYYISPRAIKDVWNMWFLKENDYLFEQIIKTMVVVNGVNPDKVYLMGYSAGGDGLWRMAPRMADHWAAASMMAGHPGSTRFENIRNMPFMMWVGANDTAYDRNTLVPATSKKIDELQAADPKGYIHECHVQPGRPHWMELDDAAAFPWMAQYTRNPYPTRIVWRQENEEEKVLRPSFYWLKPDASEIAKGKTVIAEIKGNTITLEQCDYKTLTIYLNDTLVNLDTDVTVKYKDKEVFKGPVARYEETLQATMLDRGDPSYVFCSEITVEL